MKKLLAFCVSTILVSTLVMPVPAQDQPTVQDLMKVVEDPDKSAATKRQALTDIQKLGPGAAPAIPMLTRLVTDTKAQNDREFANLARASLWCFKAIGKPGIPGLKAALKSTHLRIQAAIFLGEFGADARSAVPDMLECISTDPVHCFGMFDDLNNIGPDPQKLVPVAIQIIKAHTDGGDKADQLADPARLAAGSLAKVGPAAKDAVPILIVVLELEGKKGSNTKTVRGAIEALGEIGPDAAEALPILRTFLVKNYGNLNVTSEKAIDQIKAKK